MIKRMYSVIVIILVAMIAVNFSGCATEKAQAYLLRAYADNPERFHKCPFDPTDKRNTIVHREEYSSSCEQGPKEVYSTTMTDQQRIQRQSESEMNAAGFVKNPKSRR